MAQVDWPLLILQPMGLLAQHSKSLVQSLLLASPAPHYQSFSETLHLPQLHLPRSVTGFTVYMSIYAAAALHAHNSVSECLHSPKGL